MADYISTLTGVQVDAALLDMAEHNSEAYAVGERNGVAVASGDVTYHNNAKYYAQNASSSASTASSASSNANTKASQAATSATNAANSARAAANSATNAADSATAAEDAADRAEAIVGGQFVSYGQAQGLTDAQKAVARRNIGATPNKNLLDNWYFVGGGSQSGNEAFPINQKGSTSYSGTGNSIDRWTKSNTYGTITLGTNYITYTNNDSSNTSSLYQYIKTIPTNTTVTLSAKVRNGQIVIGFYDDTEETYYTRTFTVGSSWEIVSIPRTITHSCSRIILRTLAGKSIQIESVKLEYGGSSTLENDAPPNYVEELTKCKAYFERIKTANRATYGYFGTGVAYDTTHALIIVPMTPKIGDFSITYGGSFRLNNGGTIPVTSLAFSGSRMTNTAGVLATASGLTAGSAYLLQANNDSSAYIDITSTVFD